MRTVALYTRVSTKEQIRQGYSIEQQTTLLIKKAKELFPNDKYVIYSDEGISGKNIVGRPGMKKLLEDIKKRKIKVVMSWKLNRLSRSNRDIQNIIYEFRNGGAYYISISENIDTSTQNGEMMIGAFGLVAQIERETIVSNVKMGMNAKAKKGEAITGRVLGYTLELNQETGKRHLVIEPYEANIVKNIFDMYLNKNKGFKAIAHDLNKKGYRTINNKPFNIYGVKYILYNPLYKGYVRFNKYRSWTLDQRSGKSDENKLILVKGLHQPIITEEVFDKVYAKLISNSSKPGRPIKGDNFLRGLIKCPECGSNMVCRRSYYTSKKTNKRVKHRYYVCSLFNRSGSIACHSNSIKADTVENVVFYHLNHILTQNSIIDYLSSEVIKKLEREHQNKNRITTEISTLEKQEIQLQQQLQKLIDLYLDDSIDKKYLKQKQNQLKNQLAQVKEEINSIKVSQDKISEIDTIDFNNIKSKINQIINNLSKYIKQSSSQSKNKLLNILISSIEITQNKQVKLIKYKIDESLLPQSIKKDCGNFFMPKFSFVINSIKKNKIENLSLPPLLSDKSDENSTYL